MIVELSEARINNLIQELEYLEDTIDTAASRVTETLVKEGVTVAKALNAVAPKSGVEDNTISSEYSKDGFSGKIVMSGPNAVYDEFGTGEIGAQYSHPMKGRFPLNPYNSGPVVSQNINKYGRHYWFYKPMSGKSDWVTSTGYTEGIPAGAQMYNTLQYLRKEKNNIAKAEIKDAIAKYTK